MLHGELYRSFDGGGPPGGWVFLIEPELHVGEDVMVPDLSGWGVERVPDMGTVYFTSAPDWLCETLSPSTERLDRAKKLPRYAAAGVGHVWLLHPIRRTLEVLRLQDGKWLLVATHGRVAEEMVTYRPGLP